MTEQTITKEDLLKRLSSANESALDELVLEAASQIAANANNGGVEAQVEFLLANGYTAQEILEGGKW